MTRTMSTPKPKSSNPECSPFADPCRLGVLAAQLVALVFVLAFAGSPTAALGDSTASRIERALAHEGSARDEAIVALRRLGPPVLESLFAAEPGDSADRQSWIDVLDRVCAQRGCVHSRLYWHTDLDAARAEAERSQRPILSLRLLGRLDEELSCANSRFFRRMLYPDPRVAEVLRHGFVLHWSSERPVPTVEIDFGDGRSLTGTVTGNSVHYVLDHRGRVVDALPGLYDPGVFVAGLLRAARLASELSDLDSPTFRAHRASAHQALLAGEPLPGVASGSRRAVGLPPEDAEMEKLRDAFLREFGPGRSIPQPLLNVPTAREAAVLAATKSVVEAPLLESMALPSLPRVRVDEREMRQPRLRERSWGLSAESMQLLRESLRPFPPVQADRALRALVEALERDTLRNEYLLHPQIHHWLSDPQFAVALEEVNRVIYDDLFLTPASDPWLGLASAETLLALSVVAPRSAGGTVSGR